MRPTGSFAGGSRVRSGRGPPDERASVRLLSRDHFEAEAKDRSGRVIISTRVLK
jgi:hypothetical protein